MTNTINLTEHWAADENLVGEPLALVRLDANQTAVVPFTTDAATVKLHYCEEEEIRGYVRCNDSDCVLCLVGRKAEERVLLPVYLPAVDRVAVLPVSPAIRPALRPQLMPILKSGKKVAALISKPDRVKYQVATIDLKEGMADGAAAIDEFQKRWDAGQIDLAAVYGRYPNDLLAEVPSVATILRLKGVGSHGNQ